MSDGRIVMTRHLSHTYPDYARYSDPTPDGRPHTPVGVELRRPFPEAKVHFIDHGDGWFRVYWISDQLTAPDEVAE